MSYEEFKKHIDTARNILVGAVPSPAGQIDQITYALIYKFMSDIDDQSVALGGKRSYFTGDYDKYNWHALMSSALTASERLELYRQAIQTMARNENLPPLFREIYQNAFLPLNTANVLNLFLKEINQFSYGESDGIGDAYEYLLSITGSQGDVGQFRTPRHIIKFIVEAVNPTKDDSILDPAVGTAGFLIAAYNHVKAQQASKNERDSIANGSHLTSDERDRINKSYHGFDIDPTMVRTARVNMYLHGFTTPDIRNHDTLTSEEHWDKRYDVILANPPFMSPKGGIQPHTKFSITANRSEVLFVDYIASHINPVTGRAGIIVPEGIIFQGGKAYKELRKNLVENYLYAVVSLPAGVFQPYSGVKTSILLLDKQLAKERDDILFVKVENDGYTLGAQRRRDVQNDQIPQSLDFIRLYKEKCHQDTPYSHTVSRKEIADGDYNLSGERYRSQNRQIHHEWPMYSLGELFEMINGRAFKKDEWRPKGLPIIRIENLNNIDASYNYFDGNYEEKILVTDTDLLFSWSGTKGTSFGPHMWDRGPGLLNQHIFKLVPKRDLNKKYAYYLIKSILSSIESKAHGAGGLVHVTKTELSTFEIPIPPIEIQREIVAELDGYQKIIDAAQIITQTYRPTFKVNPEWPERTLAEISQKITDGSHNPPTPTEGPDSMPMLSSKNIVGGCITFTGARMLAPNDFHKEDRRTNVQSGDVLLTIVGAIGRTAVVSGDIPRFVLQRSVAVIKPDRTLVDPYFLRAVIDSETVQAHLANNATGVAQQGIYLRQVAAVKIPLPPIDVQRRIVAEMAAEAEIIKANEKLKIIYQQKIESKIAEIWSE